MPPEGAVLAVVGGVRQGAGGNGGGGGSRFLPNLGATWGDWASMLQLGRRTALGRGAGGRRSPRGLWD
jgi:hypothetical protein